MGKRPRLNRIITKTDGNIDNFAVFGYVRDTERKVLKFNIPKMVTYLILSFYNELEEECFGNAGKTITISDPHHRTITREPHPIYGNYQCAYGSRWISCGLRQIVRWKFKCNAASNAEFGLLINDTMRKSMAIETETSTKGRKWLPLYQLGDTVEVVLDTENGFFTKTSCDNEGVKVSTNKTEIRDVKDLEIGERHHLKCKVTVRIGGRSSLTMTHFESKVNAQTVKTD